MARTANKPQAPAPMDVIPVAKVERIEAAQDALALEQKQAQAHVRAVALQVGYQLPADSADPDLIQRDIAANMRRSVEACLEVGRGLAVLKAVCGHGNFLARLEVLGIETRVAQRFMQSAIKFSNAASTPLLNAIGNQTKLFEMLVLDDEQIDELALTGETGELHLDDIATMSVKELREALRQAKHDEQYMGDKLSKERERADQAEKRLRKGGPETRPLDERITPFQVELTERQSLLEKALLAHDEAVTALDAWWTQEVVTAPGYDPEAPAPLPAPVLAVAQHLYDAIERTAAIVGGLQHRMWEVFGDQIPNARQYLLQDPALVSDLAAAETAAQGHD
ncbi:MAG: hypothetical protein QM617_05005 [Comamonas sp.]